MVVEKIYPLSFPNFAKVLLMDDYKIRRSKLYYIRTKVGKDARFKSVIENAKRGTDLLDLIKSDIDKKEEVNIEENKVKEKVEENKAEEKVEENKVEEKVEENKVEEKVEENKVEEDKK
jgi:large subunit ribosomal protein L19